MRRGFTLIEMVVAVFLLAIGVVGALGAISSATRASGAADQIQTATLLAQQRMSEIELQPDSLTGGDQEAPFETNPSYRWKESVEATDYANLFKVTLTVVWGNPAAPQERTLTTYLRNDQGSTSPQTGATPSSSLPPTSGSSPGGLNSGGQRLGSSGG